MIEVPCFVRLAQPGTSFSDYESKFSICCDQVKEVTVVTPLLKQWIMNGGLVVCDADGVPAQLSFRLPAKAVSKTIGMGQGPVQPVQVEAATPKTPKPTKPKPTTSGTADTEDGHEKTLDELMAESK